MYLPLMVERPVHALPALPVPFDPADVHHREGESAGVGRELLDGVGSGETDDRHAGGVRCLNSGWSIFDHDALPRGHS